MKSKVKINVRYSAGHTSKHVYKKTNYFCPFCGNKNIWKDVDEFFDSPRHVCIKCEQLFYLNSAYSKELYGGLLDEDKQILDGIRNAME